MQFLETLFYFIVTLGILVFVHELGHFIAAKLTGMRVDRFSIGFPPRAFGKQIGDTDYCVSWVPIGGYVKIAGMIDESFDTEFSSKQPEPWEFRAKPIWQRMIVLSAGVFMNIVLAILIYWGVNYVQGRTVHETTEVGYVAKDSPASAAGIQPGDRVLRINETTVSTWEALLENLFIENLGDDVTMTVLRTGLEIEILIPHNSMPEAGPAGFGIIPEETELFVRTVDPGMPADQMGLMPLDVLLKLGGAPVRFDSSVIKIVQSHAGQPLEVEWKRGDTVMTGTTTPTEEGRIGISFGARYTGPVKKIEYTLFEALPEGIKEIVTVSGLFLQNIGQIITGKTAFSKSVGGPIRIAQMASQSAEIGLLAYFRFMALLSISLAIINILPVPALDGGHILLLSIEGATRREIPVGVKLGIQKVGVFLLLAFMAFVVYNDIVHY
ncbi:MAG: RIP metalloprotease RseP [Bacteroidetes bacterium]|nr:RIP metalloprotease RseP [Bacteroidota bacterium]